MCPTSKLLQKPSLIQIIGSTLRIAHPDIFGYTRTYISSPLTAAGTALIVIDNNDFKDEDWFILGEIKDGKTEECNVNDVVIRGTSLTITDTTKFAHEIDAPITKIYERGIRIYGAATDGGSGTLIASVDAITTPIADAVMIQWNKSYTEYTLISTDTTYTYYYVVFTDGVTNSPSSDYVLASGLTYASVQEMIQAALDLTGEEIGGRISREFLLRELNNWQDMVTHFSDERGNPKDWSWELVNNETSLSATENENKYALSDLTNEMKYADTKQAIQAVKFGSKILDYIDIDEFDEEMEGLVRTTVKTVITAGATSIVLTDTCEFTSSGTVTIGKDTITYTGNTKATGTLTGCSGVVNNHSVGATVWQGVTPGLPDKYTVDIGYIYLNLPVATDYVGYKIKIRYLKKLTRLTDFSDTTEIPFTNLAQYYLASKIEARKGNLEIAKSWMNENTILLLAEAKNDKLPLLESQEYYTFNF